MRNWRGHRNFFVKCVLPVWAACLCGASLAEAAEVQTPSPATIAGYFTYSNFGGGDVVFKLAISVPTCADGFWMKKSDSGFEANFATLMTAYFQGREVAVVADNAQIWTGSSGIYCRLSAIGF